MQEGVKVFPIHTGKLPLREKRVFDLLAEAASHAAVLYAQQKDTAHNGARFYPTDATREEIQEAAQKNPDILHPYTFVEKNGAGGLRAIPYHKRFEKELKRIAALLERAAVLTADKAFADYLVSRARDLLQDNYDTSNIAWLETEHSKIGFVIGAFDRYHDRLFFKKRAFTAWLGILDEHTTAEMDEFRTRIFPPERGSLMEGKYVKIPKTGIRIEDTALFAGLTADFAFLGNELPSSEDIHLIKEHGTLFTIFKPSFQWRFRKWVLPSFYAMFTPLLQTRYSKEDLERAFLRITLLHEAYRSQNRYEDACSRLQEFFPLFDEIYPDVLGIREAGSLLGKNVLSEREVEALIAIEIAQSVYFFRAMEKFPYLSQYAAGHALLNEFFMRHGVLKKGKDGFSIDFQQALLAIDKFTQVIGYYLALGTREEAKAMLQSVGFQNTLDAFRMHNSQFSKAGAF